MAKFKEIEIKWDATNVDRTAFNKAVRRYAKGKKTRFISVAGFDYYHESPEGYVARHRHGSTTNELTVKARVSKKSTTIRREINLKLAKETSPIQVQELMTELGFRNCLPIFKDCDIYFIQDGKYTVDIVWYKVSCQDKPPKNFIEVEVHEAPVKESLKILEKWTKFVESLGAGAVMPLSLWEIYSGRQYRMSRNRK